MSETIASFAGWSIVGNLGFTFKDQISNIILNLFFNTAINAARGIATQVNGVVSSFSNSFLMALNPQITKEYSQGNTEKTVKMVYSGCRLSPFLMGIICIPLMVNMEYILKLWLGNIPPYTVDFMNLTLIAAILGSMATPLVTILQATGKIKLFQIAISITMLCELPLSYIILKLGGKAYMAMYPTVFVTFVGLYVRFYVLHTMLPHYSYVDFTKIVFRVSVVLLCSYVFSNFCFIVNHNLLHLIYNILVSFVLTALFVFFLGLNKNEKEFLCEKISKRLKI